MFNLTKVLTKLLNENLIFAQHRMTKKEWRGSQKTSVNQNFLSNIQREISRLDHSVLEKRFIPILTRSNLDPSVSFAIRGRDGVAQKL